MVISTSLPIGTSRFTLWAAMLQGPHQPVAVGPPVFALDHRDADDVAILALAHRERGPSISRWRAGSDVPFSRIGRSAGAPRRRGGRSVDAEHQMHAAQAIACLKAGKHVLVEIPMADNLVDSEALVQDAAGNPGSSRWPGM